MDIFEETTKFFEAELRTDEGGHAATSNKRGWAATIKKFPAMRQDLVYGAC